jgi:hypothetical protein
LSLIYSREVPKEVHCENCMNFCSKIHLNSPTTDSFVFHSTLLKPSRSYVTFEQFTGTHSFDVKVVDRLHEQEDESDDDVCKYGVGNLSISLIGKLLLP